MFTLQVQQRDSPTVPVALHSPVSQLTPLKPGGHLQLKLLAPLRQVAPF